MSITKNKNLSKENENLEEINCENLHIEPLFNNIEANLLEQ